ncbi:hypothetical protein DSO57_1002592 [Entomophthora muscae]|uniref:Uncharacterized protein n=1 Tax=Entomophthora muscae TaxID=34485 RepID=A0ACC2U7X2_9FUNG|nr:hypothetical protein DSO57_1002592 [Entomophthora muscae]
MGEIINCCKELVFQVVCFSAFEPVIITNGVNVVACNRGAVDLFAYRSKKELLALSVRELIDLHFQPTVVADGEGNTRAACEKDITFAKVKNENSIKQAANVNTKTWNSENIKYHTISIVDIPIVRAANKKRLLRLDKALLNFSSAKKFQVALLSNLTQMADALPSLVWIVSHTGELLYQNDQVMQVFGVDTVNGSWQECLHPADVNWVLAAWMDGLRKRKHTTIEVRYRNAKKKPDPDGAFSYRSHLMQTTPIPGSTQFVCFSVDIHDLKEAESEKQRLAAKEKLAIETSKLKSAFLSMMSHEIRTPLFGIIGNICLLQDTELSCSQRELITNIEGSSKLMMAVIQDILDFSRIEAGKLRISKEPFSFNRTLSICSGMVEQAARRKGLSFKMPVLNSQVNALGDSVRILQVLNNLASNAIKFTNEGCVAIRFEYILVEETLQVKLIVSDTGIGFGPELQAQLFTPWVQADSTTQRLYGGSGLGLAITKSLVDMMGGSISTKSKPGIGSQFTVSLSLPSLDSDYDLGSSRSNPDSPNDLKFELYTSYPTHQPAECHSPKKFKVLLAEDNPINQDILRRYLMKIEDVECILTSDGQQALDEYQRHPPRHYHIILLDQSMPHMDGDEICRRIRQRDKKQIVISISANALLADSFHQSGMNDHISKPVEFTAFRNTLSYWLEQTDILYKEDTSFALLNDGQSWLK